MLHVLERSSWFYRQFCRVRDTKLSDLRRSQTSCGCLLVCHCLWSAIVVCACHFWRSDNFKLTTVCRNGKVIIKRQQIRSQTWLSSKSAISKLDTINAQSMCIFYRNLCTGTLYKSINQYRMDKENSRPCTCSH